MLHIAFGAVVLCVAQRSAALRHAGFAPKTMEASQTAQCASLLDHGTYYTTKITVGTTEFEVIPDTGSNTVIVPSCSCAAHGGGCPELDACLPTDEHMGSEAIPMSFGSGTIYGYEEQVHVSVGRDGGLSATSGALLLADRSSLNIGGTFEGVLGLGVPNAFPEDSKVGLTEFLTDSGTEGFSICYADTSEGEVGGVLRFGRSDQGAKVFPNIGVEHWAVDFRGISVGAESQPVQFCRAGDVTAGLNTPCAAIPDSGTTLLLGPQSSIDRLESEICDGWERCKLMQSKYGVEAGFVIDDLIDDCDSFDDTELPSLYFRFRSSGGEEELVELPGSMYIFKTVELGCELAFDTIEYHTTWNGDIWVLGQAFFDHYVVSFELGASADAHTIAFSSAPCGLCHNNLLRTPSPARMQRKTRRVLRGQPRRPFFNTSRPL